MMAVGTPSASDAEMLPWACQARRVHSHSATMVRSGNSRGYKTHTICTSVHIFTLQQCSAFAMSSAPPVGARNDAAPGAGDALAAVDDVSVVIAASEAAATGHAHAGEASGPAGDALPGHAVATSMTHTPAGSSGSNSISNPLGPAAGVGRSDCDPAAVAAAVLSTKLTATVTRLGDLPEGV
jgi:hypothetical protein